jgi:hypothetical protein
VKQLLAMRSTIEKGKDLVFDQVAQEIRFGNVTSWDHGTVCILSRVFNHIAPWQNQNEFMAYVTDRNSRRSAFICKSGMQKLHISGAGLRSRCAFRQQ